MTTIQSFSLLPLELREEIASYLSYKDILVLSQVESSLMDIPKDKNFWKSLIGKRFPDFINDPRITKGPKIFFSYLECHVYRIILSFPDKQPLHFMSDDKDFIAVTGLSVFEDYLSTGKKIRDKIRVIKPDGELLSVSELERICSGYIGMCDLRNSSLILFSPKRLYIDGAVGGHTVYIYHNSCKLAIHCIKILEFQEAKDISIVNARNFPTHLFPHIPVSGSIFVDETDDNLFKLLWPMGDN